ncbi:CD63 antigen-like isoform X2 [Ostrea edulis]|uniref:CD63 antigen-like isoform X2 n=1 Tax=Ostrea edulis TaxID=37623 RepID=UPI0024AF7468|nr:CD63 antigen-like isoform X2 [Ostrea edulis]
MHGHNSFVLLKFAGPALLGVTIWQYITLRSYDPILEISKFQTAAITYLAAGVLSTLNGIIGCLGGVNNRKRVVLVFLIVLVVIAGAEVFATVEFFKFYDEVPQYLSDRIRKFVHEYSSDPSTRVSLDSLQNEMRCCGANNYTDWSHGQIPRSCIQKSDNHNAATASIHKLYVNGCHGILEVWTKENLLIIGWGGFSFSILQTLGIVFSCCFYYTLSMEFE